MAVSLLCDPDRDISTRARADERSERSVRIDNDVVVMDLRTGYYSAVIDCDERFDFAIPSEPGTPTLPASDHGRPADRPIMNIAARSRGYASLAPTPGLRDVVRLSLFTLAGWIRQRRAPLHWLDWHLSRFDERDATEAEIIGLVERFRSAALLIPGLSLCLANSMALAAFLRAYGVRTRWIFGVRTYPFEAHCWLEWRDLILNDDADHARWFTPILIA